MMKFKIFCLLLVSSASVVWAADPSRKATENLREILQTGYAKSARAAEMKYINGTMVMHSNDFQGFGVDQKPISLTAARTTMEQLFRRAILVQEKIDVLSCKKLDEQNAVCEIHDQVTLIFPEKLPKPPAVVLIDTYCRDGWRHGTSGWQQVSCHALRQAKTSRPFQPSDLPANSRAF